MNDEKRALHAEARRKYLAKTMRRGISLLFSERAAVIKLAIGLLLSAGFFELWAGLSPDYVIVPVRISQILLTPLIVAALLLLLGHIKGSWKLYKDLIRSGLVNAAGEAPFLIEKKSEGDHEKLTFQSTGITLEMWQEKLEKIQSALNRTVGSITRGRDFRTITLTTVPPNMVFGKTICWTQDLINKNDSSDFVLGKTAADEVVHWNCETMPHILIGGATASGKTRLAKLILTQAILRNGEVYIVDLKGLDYVSLEARDAHLVTDEKSALFLLNDIVETMYWRRDLLRDTGAVNYKDYVDKTGSKSLHRIIVLVDEASMLTSSGTTKEAKALSQACIDKMTTLVRLGRAVGIHIIIATQVPDTNSVPTAIRANLDLKLCGKADPILSTMVLGDGRADDLIPKDSRGRFVMATGAESIVFQAYYFDE